MTEKVDAVDYQVEPIFKEMTFCFVGLDHNDKDKWTKVIEEHGGSTVDSINAKCTHVISIVDEVQKQTSKIDTATQLNLPVIPVQFIEDSITKKKICLLDQYLLTSKMKIDDSIDKDDKKRKKRKVEDTIVIGDTVTKKSKSLTTSTIVSHKAKTQWKETLLTDPLISFRKETISNINTILQETPVILIKASPYTGKTVLARLLTLHFEQVGWKVCTISIATLTSQTKLKDQEDDIDFNKFWEEETGSPWQQLFSTSQRTCIIIDEAQMAFSRAPQFWQNIKSLKQNPNSNCFIIALASCDSEPFVQTKDLFKRKLSLENILLTDNEFEELITSYNKITDAVHISAEVKTAIYRTTGLHVGLVRKTLELIRDEFSKRQNTITDQDIICYLISTEYVTLISLTPAVPNSVLSDDEKEILETILNSKTSRTTLPLDSKYESAIMTLVKNGYLNIASDNTASFASPLIRSIFINRLFSAPGNVETTDYEFEQFLETSLSRMRWSKLKNSLTTNNEITKEKWANEFYHGASRVLPKTFSITSDVGHIFGTQKAANYYVNKKEWIIELTREVENMADYEKKFTEEGIYCSLRTKVKRFVILDFLPENKRVSKLNTNFWNILYPKDFSYFVIQREGVPDTKVNLLN